MTDPKWPATYENIVECLATELSYKDKISKSSAQEIVTRILWAFWRDQIIGVYPKHFGSDSMPVQRKGIWSTSMSFCMKVIASLKFRVSRLYPFCLLGNQISYEALTRKSHKYFDDFREIRCLIEGK